MVAVATMKYWLWVATMLALAAGLQYLSNQPWPEQVWWVFLAIGVTSLLAIALIPFTLLGT
jgi:hypothetical protein